MRSVITLVLVQLVCVAATSYAETESGNGWGHAFQAGVIDQSAGKSKTVAPRTFVVSPFPADAEGVVHFGGFDGNLFPALDPACVFRGPLETVLLVAAFADDLKIAENVLLYQRATGGWPKNYDREQPLTEARRIDLLNDKSKNDSTIDNGATHTEIRLMANASAKSREQRFKQAALRGIQYLLDGQYDNGGWPQRFPGPRGYSRYITFNDNAMIGVMNLLRDVADGSEVFAFVPDAMRLQCGQAVQRGIDCILKCQVKVDGKPTAWCAQHDQVSFEPQKARSYELAALSGSESVGIVRFLMHIDDPSDEVIRAIEGAVSWFEQSKLNGIRLVRVEDAAAPKGFDQVVVEDPQAAPMWARFYDIRTNQPIFCSRDGIPQPTLAGISYERRNGYSWLGYYPQQLLKRDLPAWKHRLERR